MLFIPCVSSLPFPIGIGGTIKDQNGNLFEETIKVTSTNLETNETRNYTTSDGWYAITLSGVDGDIVESWIFYDGKTFKNQTHIDTSLTTNWLNLSLVVSTTDDEEEEEDDTSTPPPQSHSPIADFFYAPSKPNVNDSIILSSLSSDEDGDIVETKWEIESNIQTGETISYTFTHPGDFTVILIVEDSEGNTDSLSKTITIFETEQDIDNDTSNEEDNNQNETEQDIENDTSNEEDNNTNTTNTTDNTTNNFFKANITVYDDNNKPLTNAKVKISSTNFSETYYTDSNGVIYANLPEGEYTISAYKNEDKVEEKISLNSDKNIYLAFTGTNPLNKTEDFNWWFIIIITVILIAIIGVFIWYKGQKSWF
ncbi:MAG: PKD domain-containing protein [Petrotogales bacterium]